MLISRIALVVVEFGCSAGSLQGHCGTLRQVLCSFYACELLSCWCLGWKTHLPGICGVDCSTAVHACGENRCEAKPHDEVFFQVTTPMLVWTKRMVRLPDVVAVTSILLDAQTAADTGRCAGEDRARGSTFWLLSVSEQDCPSVSLCVCVYMIRIERMPV